MKLQRPDPGIDAAKSGLHGKAGIFFNAGLLSKGGGFNPLDLDPYLLFDARTSMIGTLENPTLDLDPSKQDTLDVITATRAGVATYTDFNGLIASAPANTVRVDQTQGAELTPTKFQRVLNTSIGSPNGVQSAELSQVTGLLGEQDGIRITETTTNSAHYALIMANVLSGTTYTVSFYIKQGSYSTVRLYTQTSFIDNNTLINFTTETATNNASLEDVGGGWYRVVMEAKAATQSGSMAIYPTVKDLSAYAGDVNNFTDYYGFQVEEGTTASDFVANTTGSPQFITGPTFGPRVPMILVEPSATNTIRWSEDSTAYNYGAGITFESSDVLAPNGQASAFKMTPNDTSSLHRGGALDTAGSWNANDVITYSVWVKTDGYDYILNIGGFFGNEAATFDTLDGSLIGNESNVISASSEDYGNGWFRYVVTYTFQNIITNNYVYSGIRLYKRDASGNATSWDATGETTGVLVYGSQFEAGNVATSYIPTDNDASGVTRAKDDLSIDPDSTNLVTHSDFSGGWQEYLINSSAGSGYSLNASRVITSTGANAAYYIPMPTSNGATYTASIWARRVSGSGGCNIIYLSSPTAKQSISLTSEFQKFTATFTGKSGGGNVNFGVDIVTSGDSIEIAMPQVELGSSPTGFIPTSGAASSRTAFSDFYNQSEGTFYLEFEPRELSTSIVNTAFELSNGTGAERILSLVDSQIHAYFVDGGNVQAHLDAGTNTVGVLNRLAVSYKANNIQVSVSGGAVVSDTSASIPTVDRLIIGNQVDDTTRLLNGHIKRLIYWPYHSDSL